MHLLVRGVVRKIPRNLEGKLCFRRISWIFRKVPLNVGYAKNLQFLLKLLMFIEFEAPKTESAAQDLDIEENEELGMQKTPFKSGFVSIIGNANVGKSTLMNGR